MYRTLIQMLPISTSDEIKRNQGTINIFRGSTLNKQYGKISLDFNFIKRHVLLLCLTSIKGELSQRNCFYSISLVQRDIPFHLPV